MPAIKLTAKYVENVRAEGGRLDVRDAGARGLWLRVTPSGIKTWALVYRRKSDGRVRRYTLGAFPGMSLDAARTEAGEKLAAVRRGADPAGGVVERREAATFRELAVEWICLRAEPEKSERAAHDDAILLARFVIPEIGNMKLTDIRRRDVVHVLDKAKAAPDARLGVESRRTTVRPNSVHSLLRAMFNWAVGRGAMASNPAAGVKRPMRKAAPRDRVLAPDEVRSLWAVLCAAADGSPPPGVPMSPPIARALRLALVTGQRIGEVTGARRAAVDLNDTAPVWVIPPEGVGRAKNREKHRVPLAPLAVALFREALAASAGEWLFPGRVGGGPIDAHAPTRAVGRSRAAIGVPNWRVHDLRRTAATLMAEAGVPDYHISLVLNHVSVRRGSVTGKVYNQYKYDAEKRQALAALGERVSAIVTDSPGNVVGFPRLTENNR